MVARNVGNIRSPVKLTHEYSQQIQHIFQIKGSDAWPSLEFFFLWPLLLPTQSTNFKFPIQKERGLELSFWRILDQLLPLGLHRADRS